MLRTALLLLAIAGTSLGAVDNILDNAGAFKPRISVSDRYDERVAVTVEDGFIFRELVPNPQNIAITVTANLDGADVGTIDANTSVGVTAWHFDHSATLGDAPDYKPGAKRATFPLTMDYDLPTGETRTRTVGSVVYTWTTKLLTVTVTCTDIAGAGVGDVAASDYVGVADPGTTVVIDNDEIDVAVNFGNASGSRRVFLKGQSKTVTRGFGSVADDSYEEFDLTTVTLAGAADVVAPFVRVAWPTKPTLTNTISAVGSATDIELVSIGSVTVNNVPVNATVAIDDPEGTGTWAWSVTNIPLRKGTNNIAITFTDEDGNEAKITRAYVVR